jgi:dipeptidyl-peptidase-4
VTDSFPRRQARTRRFTLGAPRGLSLSPDGARVTFLRSRGGTDAVTCLWTLDPVTAEERLVADPRMLDAGSDDDVPPEERARRERAREQAGGIVAYATDGAGDVAAFALSGRAYVTGLTADGAPPRPLDSPGPVFYRSQADQRPRRLRQRRRAARPRPRGGHHSGPRRAPSTTVTYGLTDFVAAEEMNRMRG